MAENDKVYGSRKLPRRGPHGSYFRQGGRKESAGRVPKTVYMQLLWITEENSSAP